MLPYWILFAIFAVGSLLYRIRPRDRAERSPIFFIAAAATALMIGLRYRVGTDWENYLDIYDITRRAAASKIWAMGDPAYMFLNAFSAWIGAGIWLVNLVCGVIFMIGLTIFARRQPNPWLAITVAVPYFVIVVAMGYTRQAVAIGIFMIAVGEFERERYLRFAVLILFAVTFHKSVILILPLVGVSVLRHRAAVYIAALAIAFLMFTVFLDRFLNTLVTTYVSNDLGSQGVGIRVAMNILPATVFLGFSRRFSVSEQERVIWRNFSIAALGTLVGLAVLPSTAVDRLALYLIPIQIFVLSRLPYAFPLKGKPNAQMMMAVLLYSGLVQLVWLGFAANAEYWLPYRAALG